MKKKTPESMGPRSIGYAENWAWRLRFLSAPLKLLLIAMARQCNAAGVCEVPVRWLADHCNVAVRHTQKEIVILSDLGLITAVELSPGTVDKTRYFCLQTHLDPDVWEPGKNDVLLMRHRGTAAITAQAFQQRLCKICYETPRLESLYASFLGWIVPLGINAPKGPNARLRLLVKHPEVVDVLHRADVKAVVLRAASEVSGVDVKKFQITHSTKDQSTK